MLKIQRAMRRFIADEEGAALAEYGILIAFIAIVAVCRRSSLAESRQIFGYANTQYKLLC